MKNYFGKIGVKIMIKFKSAPGTIAVYLEDVLLGYICKRHRLTPRRFIIRLQDKINELEPADLRRIANRIEEEREPDD